MVARKHPERFNKIAVIYQKELPNNRSVNRWAFNNCTTNELIGIVQTAIVEILTEMKN